jgi:hypothetical protein
MKRIANMNGMSYSRSIMPEFTKQLASGNHQKEAISMGLGINEMIGSMMRFGDADMISSATKSGRFNASMQSVASMVMKASGLNATTAAAKRAFSLVHMHKIADMTRSKQWSELGEHDLKMFKGNGIKEEDWNLWRDLTPSKRENGEMVLTQNDFFSAPDDVIKKHIGSELTDIEANAKAEIEELNNRNTLDDQRIQKKMQSLDDEKRKLSQRLLDYANRKDSQAQAEKQALQDRMNLIDAQKEAAAAQADMNAYIRTIENQEDLKGFVDGITQGKTIDSVNNAAFKLGKRVEKLSNQVATKTTAVNKKVKSLDSEVQKKFEGLTELLDNKTKYSKEQLNAYGDKLATRLNEFSTRRDIKSQNAVKMLNELIEINNLKKEQFEAEFDLRKAENQARIKTRTDKKIDSSVSRITTKNYQGGERIGKRIGSAERRIVEIKAKMRAADSAANKAINQKFTELDRRINEIEQGFTEYQAKIKETQFKREKVMERIARDVQPRIDRATINARYDFARRYMNHIFSEEGVAVIDSGARERSLTQFGQAGTFQGELGRTLFQFKAYPMGYLMRMGSRAFAQDDITSRATFLISLLAYQTIAGGMVAQLQNIANGKQPEPVFTTDFFLKSILKGGGFSFLGDLMSAMSDPTGRGMGDFVAGPLIGSAFKLGMLFTGIGNNIIEGKESTRGMEIANAIKSNIPFQNLWYTKLVIDRMLYSKMQNMIDPDYLRRTQTRMENLGNQYWWDLDND